MRDAETVDPEMQILQRNYEQSLATFSTNFNCFCKQQLWFAKINHSCYLQKKMKIEIQVERLYWMNGNTKVGKLG